MHLSCRVLSAQKHALCKTGVIARKYLTISMLSNISNKLLFKSIN